MFLIFVTAPVLYANVKIPSSATSFIKITEVEKKATAGKAKGEIPKSKLELAEIFRGIL